MTEKLYMVMTLEKIIMELMTFEVERFSKVLNLPFTYLTATTSLCYLFFANAVFNRLKP